MYSDIFKREKVIVIDVDKLDINKKRRWKELRAQIQGPNGQATEEVRAWEDTHQSMKSIAFVDKIRLWTNSEIGG